MVVPTTPRSHSGRSRRRCCCTGGWIPVLIAVVFLLNLVVTYHLLGIWTTWKHPNEKSSSSLPHKTIDHQSQTWWNQRQTEIQSIRRRVIQPSKTSSKDDKEKIPSINQQQQFLDYDSTIVSHFNLSCGESASASLLSSSSSSHCVHMVQVGRQGPAVKTAITHGFFQRRVGYPRKYFDMVATSKCLTMDNDMTNNNVTLVHPFHNTTAHLPRQRSTRATTTTTTSTTKWKATLPQAMLIGVQKAGTTALYHYLDQHPQVTRTIKEIYFLDEQIDEMVIANGGKGIPQRKAQQWYSKFMMQSFLPMDSRKDQEEAADKLSRLQNNKNQGDSWQQQQQQQVLQPTKMILDLTPHYILESDRMPARISCIVPWVKLLVLLRNPIDRARSQYDMKLGVKKKKKIRDKQRNHFGYPIPTFEEYIQNDIAALQETGVIQDWNKIPFDDFWNTPAMWEAWRTYLHSGLNAPVGMGLYALQLQPFLDLPNDMLVIQSEDLKAHSNATFQRVLEFLKLPPHELPSYPLSNHARQPATISPTTKKLLQDVFEPFNRKLGDLLGKEWQGVWKSS